MANRLANELDHIVGRTESLWGDLRGGRILITGATGFFGCWLLESFAWANQRLSLNATAVALSRRPQLLQEKAPHLATDPAISLHSADVRSGDFPHGEFSHVIHAATEASATLNRETPLVMFDTIVEGTRRALQFALANSVSRFLFVSSGAVYGTQPPGLQQVTESFTGGPDPLDRGSAYAEGKRAAELLCLLAASQRLTTTIARCFAFVGPYMPIGIHFAIGNFISDAIRGGPIRVEGDGSAVRSYLYAADLAAWLWSALFKGRSGRAYNVGSEDAINIAALANAVASEAPHKVEITIAQTPVPGNPVHRYVPSTARAREELGVRAEVPLDDAIRRTYLWFSHASFQSRWSRAAAAAGGIRA
jgi:nucleoside-diphosphate-sugar epimerase